MHYPVHHRVLTWTTSLDDEPFSCDVHVYDSINSSSDSPPVLNLNGIGESSYSAAVAPTILGENVISPILPLQSELALTPKRVEAMADEVIKLIVDDALARINQGRPTNKAHTSTSIIGRSQGGAIALFAAAKHPKLFRCIALVMPFGLNQQALGSTTRQRKVRLSARFARLLLETNLLDKGHMSSLREIMRYTLFAARTGALARDMNVAMLFDLVPKLEKIATRIPTVIFMGERDPLFPARELEQAVAHTQASLVRIPDSHATPGSQVGRRHLQQAYAWILTHGAEGFTRQ